MATANAALEEEGLIAAAVSWLREKLPATWTVQARNREATSSDEARGTRLDAIIDLRSPQSVNTVVVEAKRSFTPRDAQLLLPGVARRLRLLNPNYPILVVAPWISGQTQAILSADDVNFLDLTGNARLALEYPPLFISSQGATRNPIPAPRGVARVRGPKAGRLLRLLVDVAPPYGVAQIASATGLAPGYVSRLLDSLDKEALVERSRRGLVVSTDIQGLLLRWTLTYDVFKSNAASTFVAPQGPTKVLERLAAGATSSRVAVTGSFAAVQMAPIAAPSLLIAYCSDVAAFASECQLLPADRGTDVVALRPFDEVVWERTTRVGGVTYTAASQTAADCMTGNGRMPAEGEAVLSWMQQDDTRWRLPSLDLLVERGTRA